MRYGILSDIHGNLGALDAVVASAAERAGAGTPDGWICLGDTVGYGPEPNECVERVRSLCETVLIGNHDLAAINKLDVSWFNPYAKVAAKWTIAALTPESRLFLEGLPETAVLPDWDTTFSHGSLVDPPRDYITNRLEARVNFRLLATGALFIGHSHLSHYFTRTRESGGVDEEKFHGGGCVQMRGDCQYIINCGSVGQPRDHDPRAAYGIYDVESRAVEVIRVKYDIGRVQAKIEAAGLPSFLAARLAVGS